MKIIKSIKLIRSEIRNLKKEGKTIGLVPTMGAIHDGHLSLVSKIKKQADITIASIFVNPTQFNNLEDYNKYPQRLKTDIEKLKSLKTDILFTPEESEIYPKDFYTSMKIEQLTKNLCGKTRPGHFEGVALIITKLFNIINPDFAIFGEKDFQQLQVIKRLVKDLNFETKIINGTIIREENGLALSSRNLRLNDNNKNNAAKIYQILNNIKKQILISENNSNLDPILNNAKKELLNSGFEKIDYLEICDENNLQLIKTFDKEIKLRIFIAVYLQGIRLIDNLKLY